MKNFPTILFQLCLINYLISCNPTANDKVSATTYSLEIVDSVQVDFLGNLDLYAVHSTQDLFLFHDFSRKILILTDQSGEVLSTFDQPGDAPTSLGNIPCAATFKSRYFQGEAFNFIRPMFQVNDNQIHFVFATDTLFHTYDLSQQENKMSVEGIPFDGFILNPGYPMGGREDYDTPKSKEGMVEPYFNLGGKGLILYRSGLSRENFPFPGTATKEEWNEIDARLNPLKFLVREAEGTYSNIGLCPPLFTPIHVDGKNRLWARQNVELLDHEPEFYTIYQVVLVSQ